MAYWALVKLTQNPKYIYVGGGCYRVEEVKEADFAPSSEWQECYPSTRVGWYHERGVFVSHPQLIYLRDNMHPIGGTPPAPCKPSFMPVWAVVTTSLDEFSLKQYNVDIHNTTFDMLKANITGVDTYEKNETLVMNGTRNISLEQLQAAMPFGENSRVMMRRLRAILEGGEKTEIIDGKKITTKEQICKYEGRALMKWFPTGEIVVSETYHKRGPQEGWPAWYDVVLDILG